MTNRFDILLSHMRKCMEEHEMIKEGDRVLAAVSGGKDSLALALGLKALSRFYPVKFTVSAVTVDMGFDGTDFSRVSDLFAKNGIAYDIIKTDISKAIAPLPSPCSLCARMRRAALCEYAVNNGYNSIALGHTEDDAAETALMNILYVGHFAALDPVFEYENKGISMIRPMLTTGEKLVLQICSDLSLPTVKNPCGRENDSARDEVRNIIKNTDKTCRGTAHRICLAAYEKSRAEK